MKRIHIVLEAMDYSYLIEVKPPNITSFFPDIHPAVTWGLGSRPSTGAYMGGMLPVCQIPGCFHRQIGLDWCNPFFMSIMRKSGHLFLLCGNGWSLELLLPWMDFEQKELNLRWVEFKGEKTAAEEMVDYFLANEKVHENYYAYLHFFETHYPFVAPGLPRDGTHRREALLYVDEQIGRILGTVEDSKIIICSDHNLPPKIVSAAFDVPASTTMLSFIATNFKNVPRTYDGNHLELAREIWLRRC